MSNIPLIWFFMILRHLLMARSLANRALSAIIARKRSGGPLEANTFHGNNQPKGKS